MLPSYLREVHVVVVGLVLRAVGAGLGARLLRLALARASYHCRLADQLRVRVGGCWKQTLL